jgi:hypothetical protein
MRIGFNPHKDVVRDKSDYLYQVIIPVYIPNFEGYFKDGLVILKFCIESLLKTSHSKTFITIVNNGSCNEVKHYLDNLLEKNSIHELVHTQNIGKLNAILKGLSGSNFDLITISDSDVMFLDNWQKATYTIFEAFPKAGSVCPTPSPRSLRIYTANIYWNYFFSNKMKFSAVENPEALLNFAHSIGNENFYNSEQLSQYLTINNNGVKAVVGSGHFVATYRSEIFENLAVKYSEYKLGGDSEYKILDLPVVKKGFWRLSTAQNYAYHLGNVKEDWMDITFQKIAINNESLGFSLPESKRTSRLMIFIQNKVFAKFLFNKKYFKYFLLQKGLSKQAKNHYI